jgi:hypothetical protein
MDIGPISAIRPVTMVKPVPTAPDLSRVFEVEYLGRSGDDEYMSNHRKAARGLEDEEEGDAEAAEPEAPPQSVAPGRVNFFA